MENIVAYNLFPYLTFIDFILINIQRVDQIEESYSEKYQFGLKFKYYNS